MRKRSKNYQEASKAIDLSKAYSLEEAINLLKELPAAKFDETVELHLNTRADPRHADQLIRSVVMMVLVCAITMVIWTTESLGNDQDVTG